ncbi:YwbE family protein [bacterium]|nr:YwbE family protein [bacterium]
MENNKPSGKNRSNIKIGSNVEVVQKNDQRSGKLTSGVVKRILTNSPKHSHGIKVMLESGIVGRVKNILSEND